MRPQVLACACIALVVTSCAATDRAATTTSSPTDRPQPSVQSHAATTGPATPAPEFSSASAPPRARHAHVTRVVDGDTIVLSGIDIGEIDHSTGGHRARLIGINTPEVFGTVGCYGQQASAFTKSVLTGRDVVVDFDVQLLDKFARALVYVWQDDGSFFNARLAAEGYAVPLTIPPDVRYADLFVRLSHDARIANRGLWKSC